MLYYIMATAFFLACGLVQHAVVSIAKVILRNLLLYVKQHDRFLVLQEAQDSLAAALPVMFQQHDVASLGYIMGLITICSTPGRAPAISGMHTDCCT